MEMNKGDSEAAKVMLDQMYNQLVNSLQQQTELQSKFFALCMDSQKSVASFSEGMASYLERFAEPQKYAIQSFLDIQRQKAEMITSQEDLKDFSDLLEFNFELAGKAFQSTLVSMTEFHMRALGRALNAVLTSINENGNPEALFDYARKQAALFESVVCDYPQAIRSIKAEYGFHFERPGYKKVAETEHFFLYQVLPSDKGVAVRNNGKPVLLIPPYVLGENILCFLPGEQKSYAHAYANQGVPTYVRVVKDIATTPAVQDMTGEDDVSGTRAFCEKINALHGRPLTLNGYCQGGFFATLALLTGELDGLVDSLITCVSPLDGTRSVALAEFMQNIPDKYTELGYAVRELSNGKPVVNGKIMSWVYKLKSIETEAPLVNFYRDLAMFENFMESGRQVGKTALAINYWLLHEQVDMPVAITKISFDSYNIPVDKDGTLPIRLFDRQLNFKRLAEKNIEVLICVAESDDLVDRDAAVAACDYIDAEVAVFPKGHAAIATSWSHPESQCALHTTFGDNYRGPVRFHLDLEAKQDQAARTALTASAAVEKAAASPKKISGTSPTAVKKPVRKPVAKTKAVAKSKAAVKPKAAVKTETAKVSSTKTPASKGKSSKARAAVPKTSTRKPAAAKAVAAKSVTEKAAADKAAKSVGGSVKTAKGTADK
jgi:hypothetical protein